VLYGIGNVIERVSYCQCAIVYTGVYSSSLPIEGETVLGTRAEDGCSSEGDLAYASLCIDSADMKE
jgi:hypothetical protein